MGVTQKRFGRLRMMRLTTESSAKSPDGPSRDNLESLSSPPLQFYLLKLFLKKCNGNTVAV